MPLDKDKCFYCGSREKLYPAPTCADVRQKWLEAIPNAHPGVFTKDFRLCQLHFAKNSVVFGRHLLRSAVPSLFERNDVEAGTVDQPQTAQKSKVVKFEPTSSKKTPQAARKSKIVNSNSTSSKKQPEIARKSKILDSDSENQPQSAFDDEMENYDSDTSEGSSTVIVIEEVSEPISDPLAIPDPLEYSPPKSPELPQLQRLKRLKLRGSPTASAAQQMPKQKIVQSVNAMRPKESPTSRVVAKRVQISPVQKLVQSPITRHLQSSLVKSVQPSTAKPLQTSSVQREQVTAKKRLPDSPIQQIEQPATKKPLLETPVLRIQPRTTRKSRLQDSSEKKIVQPATSKALKDSLVSTVVQPTTSKSLQDSSIQPNSSKQRDSPIQKIEQTTTATKRLQASPLRKTVESQQKQQSPLRTTPKLTKPSVTTTTTSPVVLESAAATKSPNTTQSPATNNFKNTITPESATTSTTPPSKTKSSNITYPLSRTDEKSRPEGRVRIAEMSVERLKLKIERVNLRSRDVQKRINVLKYKINTYQEFIATLVAKNIISRESAKKFEVLQRDIKRKARRDAMKIHKRGRDLTIDPVTDHDYL